VIYNGVEMDAELYEEVIIEESRIRMTEKFRQLREVLECPIW